MEAGVYKCICSLFDKKYSAYTVIPSQLIKEFNPKPFTIIQDAANTVGYSYNSFYTFVTLSI